MLDLFKRLRMRWPLRDWRIFYDLAHSDKRRRLRDRRIFLSDLHLSYKYDLAHFDEHGFCPRRDLQPVKLPHRIDWAADPFSDRNWCFQLHAWRMNAPTIRAFEEAGDAKHLRRAFDVALDWALFHDRKKAKMSWMDMAVGLRAKQLAYFLDQERIGTLTLNKAEKRRLDRMVAEHREKLSDPRFLSKNNHGVFQTYGLKLLEIVTGAENSVADGMMGKVLETQFTDDGVHKENSPDYHRLITRILASFNENGRLSREVGDTIRKAEGHLSAFVFPDRKLACVGDTQGTDDPPVPNDSLTVTDLSKSGYVIVRKKNSMLFVTGMAQSYAHKHVDELSFQLFHDGQFVFIDAGKYGYTLDNWRDYVMSADAHNTISLVEERIPIRSIDLTGSLLERHSRADDCVTIKGHVSRKDLFDHSREIVYEPERELLIRDTMSSQEERTFVSTLLLAPNLRPARVEGGFDLQLTNGQLLRARTDARFEFVRGGKRPVLGWWSPAYGKIKPTTAVRAYRAGKQASIDWEITFA